MYPGASSIKIKTKGGDTIIFKARPSDSERISLKLIEVSIYEDVDSRFFLKFRFRFFRPLQENFLLRFI